MRITKVNKVVSYPLMCYFECPAHEELNLSLKLPAADEPPHWTAHTSAGPQLFNKLAEKLRLERTLQEKSLFHEQCLKS